MTHSMLNRKTPEEKINAIEDTTNHQLGLLMRLSLKYRNAAKRNEKTAI